MLINNPNAINVDDLMKHLLPSVDTVSQKYDDGFEIWVELALLVGNLIFITGWNEEFHLVLDHEYLLVEGEFCETVNEGIVEGYTNQILVWFLIVE